MFKQISTYGAVLLATMIVIRAKSIVDNDNISDLHQRQADHSFEEYNLNLLSSNHIEIKPIERKDRLNIDVKSIHHAPSPTVQFQEIAVIEPLNNLPEKLIDSSSISNNEPEIDEKNSLSLDSENTINSNLSLLFPRQEIRSRSNRDNLNQ